MKLNAIKLEASVISDLYKKNLVEPKSTGLKEKQSTPQTVVADTPKKAESDMHFLGENKKNIMVLINYKTVNIIPDEELQFLTNMLSACKLNLADVAIINLDKITNPTYKQITSKVAGNTTLLFGISPSMLELPVDFPHFQVQSFNNSTFLYTPSLEDIKEDKVLKSKLWVCLRKIFNL
ncbi:MAG: hypothetical protein ABUT20_15240 [Bacteroidota bacterium]